MYLCDILFKIKNYLKFLKSVDVVALLWHKSALFCIVLSSNVNLTPVGNLFHTRLTLLTHDLFSYCCC